VTRAVSVPARRDHQMSEEYITHSGGCHCGAVAFEWKRLRKIVASD